MIQNSAPNFRGDIVWKKKQKEEPIGYKIWGNGSIATPTKAAQDKIRPPIGEKHQEEEDDYDFSKRYKHDTIYTVLKITDGYVSSFNLKFRHYGVI